MSKKNKNENLPIKLIDSEINTDNTSGVKLYDSHDGDEIQEDPVFVAARLLGMPDDSKFERVSKSEFQFTGYGLSLRFRADGERWSCSVNQSMTRGKCTQAAYWLLDKLAADTDEQLFYTPGREGIRR